MLGGGGPPLGRPENHQDGEVGDSGVQEAVEGVVGRLQVEEHLAHLGVVQLVRGGHAAQSL